MSILKTEKYTSLETGEILTAITIIKDKKDKDFVKVYKMFTEQLLTDLKSLNGETKLLFWFLGKTMELPIQSDLWIPIDYEELEKELGAHRKTIERWIRTLKEKGYIEQFKRNQSTFRIKPEYLYKGNLTKYKQDEIDRILK